MTSLPLAQRKLTSFDGAISLDVKSYRPDRYRDILPLLKNDRPIAIRGSGLSYGLASAGKECVTVDMTQFDRILQFDRSTGLLRVESGASVGEVSRFAVSHGYYLAVAPGYPAITIGGCVAMNIHGKSQFATGHFEKLIEAFTLFHPDHGEVRCSRHENGEVFSLTLGGLGLTGLIVDVTLRLEPLLGSHIEINRLPCNDALQAVELMGAKESQYPILYSWNNFSCHSGRLGRGFLYAERFIGNPKDADFGPLPVKFLDSNQRPPVSVLTRLTVPLVNRIYGWKETLAPRVTKSLIGVATFPIVGKEFYFSMFGKLGFREYQLLIPHTSFAKFNECLSHILRKHNITPSLGSLKIFKGHQRDLCFMGDGVCLALDIPVSGHPNLAKFLDHLDCLVIDHEGKANIAKDSRMQREVARKMFEQYDEFWHKIRKWCPSRRFAHSMRSRLEPL